MKLWQNTDGQHTQRTNGPRHIGHSLLPSSVSSSPVISCTCRCMSVVLSHLLGGSSGAEPRWQMLPLLLLLKLVAREGCVDIALLIPPSFGLALPLPLRRGASGPLEWLLSQYVSHPHYLLPVARGRCPVMTVLVSPRPGLALSSLSSSLLRDVPRPPVCFLSPLVSWPQYSLPIAIGGCPFSTLLVSLISIFHCHHLCIDICQGR